MRRLIALVAVTEMTMIGLVAVASPAHAAFPGKNGRIAFSTDQGDNSQVFTVGSDGTGLKQLTHVTAGSAANAPSWSPDGSKIVFTIDNQVWVMNGDGSRKRQLTDQSGFENHTPTWSPDARRIVFSHCGVPFGFLAYCDIDIMNADGTGMKKILGGNWMNNNPKYSPDGKRIAFDSDRGGYQSAVWVMNADGGGLKRLTKPVLEADFPGWSPNGSHIIFTDFCCLGAHGNVWVIRPDGKSLKELTHIPVGHAGGLANYSPDGKEIVLITDFAYPDECCYDLYVMNADGSNLHPIVTTQPGVLLSDWGPAVTP